MAFDPPRIMDLKWAFSTKKQANYATLVAEANLNKRVAVLGGPISTLDRNRITDAELTGKGHEFATTSRELTRDIRMAYNMRLTSLMAGWAAAFGMGAISSVQPDAVNNPTCWRHTITLLDPTSALQAPVTTIYEELWGQAAAKRKLHAMAMESFTFSGSRREVAQLAMEMIGSGQDTDTASVTVPAFSAISELDMGGMLFKLGPQAAAVDLSERLIDFSVTIQQNTRAEAGYTPGSGKFRSHLWVGNRAISANWTMHVDKANTDIMDLLEADTIREVSFKLVGDVIKTGESETHDVEILFPAVRVTAAPIGEQEDLMIYQCSIEAGDVYKDGSGTPDEPVQIIVTNEEAAYLAT